MPLASVDPYLGRLPRGEDYNCLHFTREVWLEATGDDIGDRLRLFDETVQHRTLMRSDVKAFERLSIPRDPCLVLMRKPQRRPHVGVFIRGRVLHLRDDGSAFDALDIIRMIYDSVVFYV